MNEHERFLETLKRIKISRNAIENLRKKGYIQKEQRFLHGALGLLDYIATGDKQMILLLSLRDQVEKEEKKVKE